MQPTEGLDSYITAIDSLCARLQKSDADRKMCFIRGLTPALHPFVMRENPKSFHAAVQLARLAMESESVTTPASSTGVANVSTPSLQHVVHEQKKAIEELRRQLASLMTPPPVVAAAVDTTTITTCQLCSNAGHVARECRLYTDGRRKEITCHYCKKRGHVERNCYSKERDQRRGQQPQPQPALNLTAPSK